MSRSGSVFSVLLVGFLVLLVSRPAGAGPTLVFDVETGTVLHADDAGKPWYPASLTKLMTGYVVFHAIRNGQLSLESQITYSDRARAEPASKIGLPAGTKLSVDWALQALLVRSANDIAVALAEAAGGSEANFVQMMNEHAARLAMTGTYFSNPHGLPDRRNITTARDMGLLARAIIRDFPEHQRFFEAENVKHGKRRLRNRNAGFLNLSEFADGMKTGFICNSGFNVVASQTRDGRRLVAVVLGAKNGGTRAQLASTLLEDGFVKRPGGLLSRPRKLIELTNGGLFARYPTDMAKVVCRRMGTVRITAANTVRGWSVVLARKSNAVGAQDFLDHNLTPLKSVVYGGRAAVVRTPDKAGYAAMIYNLDSDQCRKVCASLRSSSQECEILQPDTFKELLARLKEEKQEEPKPAYTKPVKRQEQTTTRKRRINQSNQRRTTTTSTPSPAARPSPSPQGGLSLR